MKSQGGNVETIPEDGWRKALYVNSQSEANLNMRIFQKKWYCPL